MICWFAGLCKANKCQFLNDYHETGLPVISKYANKVKGYAVLVKWTPPIQGQCLVHAYSIYYRETSSSEWTSTKVTKNTTHYILQLICQKEYEIAVTAWSTNGETSLNDSKLWKVITVGGNTHACFPSWRGTLTKTVTVVIVLPSRGSNSCLVPIGVFKSKMTDKKSDKTKTGSTELILLRGEHEMDSRLQNDILETFRVPFSNDHRHHNMKVPRVYVTQQQPNIPSISLTSGRFAVFPPALF